MDTRVDHLLDESLQLLAADLLALVAVLLDSLDGSDDAGIPEAWRAEIARRRAGLRDGSIITVPWAEARVRLERL